MLTAAVIQADLTVVDYFISTSSIIAIYFGYMIVYFLLVIISLLKAKRYLVHSHAVKDQQIRVDEIEIVTESYKGRYEKHSHKEGEKIIVLEAKYYWRGGIFPLENEYNRIKPVIFEYINWENRGYNNRCTTRVGFYEFSQADRILVATTDPNEFREVSKQVNCPDIGPFYYL